MVPHMVRSPYTTHHGAKPRQTIGPVMPTRPLPFSNEDTITIAACHTCCARRGEPCLWSGPSAFAMHRARKSHPDRVHRARKIFHENQTEVDKTLSNI